MTVGQPKETVFSGIRSRIGMCYVNVVVIPAGFTLPICRRDDGRWQVIRRTGEHLDQEKAVAWAREIAGTCE